MALTDEQVEILFGKFDGLIRQLHTLSKQLQVFLDASAITDPVEWKKWLLLNKRVQLQQMTNQFSAETISGWKKEIDDEWYPMIIGGIMSLDNSFLLVKFASGVYGDDAASTPVAAGSFHLKLRKNGGTPLSVVEIASVSKRNGGTLVGGEAVIRLNLSLTGAPAGVETIEIRPVNDTCIFDANGHAATIDQSTGEIGFVNG